MTSAGGFVTHVSCALFYFSLIEWLSSTCNRIPFLSKIPCFVFAVTSTLSLLLYLTVWFAYQKLSKDIIKWFFRFDDFDLDLKIQPLLAVVVAASFLDAALEIGVPGNSPGFGIGGLRAAYEVVLFLVLRCVAVVKWTLKKIFVYFVYIPAITPLRFFWDLTPRVVKCGLGFLAGLSGVVLVVNEVLDLFDAETEEELESDP